MQGYGVDLDRSKPVLALAMLFFAGSHWVLSHPLRKALIKSLGLNGFLAVYSIIALIALALVALAHDARQPGPCCGTAMPRCPG
jgi:uncharacterized membrane protein